MGKIPPTILSCNNIRVSSVAFLVLGTSLAALSTSTTFLGVGALLPMKNDILYHRRRKIIWGDIQVKVSGVISEWKHLGMEKTLAQLGMAMEQVRDMSFPSILAPDYIVISHPRHKPVSRQVDWSSSSLTKKLITPSSPRPECPLSPNPNWWWVDLIPKCTFLSLQNNEIMIIYQIWKNNIKVEINTTTINNFN